MFEIIYQKNSVDSFCRVDKIYDCFQQPRVLRKGCAIQIYRKLAIEYPGTKRHTELRS